MLKHLFRFLFMIVLGGSFLSSDVLANYTYGSFQPTKAVRTTSVNKRNNDPLPTNRIRRPYAYNDPLFFPHIRRRNSQNYEPNLSNSFYNDAARSLRRKVLREAQRDDRLPYSIYSPDYYRDYSNNRIRRTSGYSFYGY